MSFGSILAVVEMEFTISSVSIINPSNCEYQNCKLLVEMDLIAPGTSYFEEKQDVKEQYTSTTVRSLKKEKNTEIFDWKFTAFIFSLLVLFQQLSFPKKSKNDKNKTNLYQNARTPYSLIEDKEPPTSFLISDKIDSPILCRSDTPDSRINSLVEMTHNGIRSHSPEMIHEGLGGTYLLKDINNKPVTIFKPSDEEPTCENNPKRAQDPSAFTDQICPIEEGQGYVRENIAYLLDHDNFANVPATTIVEIENEKLGFEKKIGCLQEFVPHQSDCSDLGCNLFPVEEVHKIAILDCRLVNADRHSGNILYQPPTTPDGSVNLIPIDHGYCLPKSLSFVYFEWQYWNQSKIPLSKSSKTYIENLNIDMDVNVLRQLNVSKSSQNILKISTLLLKKCAERNLTLFDIATLMSRPSRYQPSPLEIMVQISCGIPPDQNDYSSFRFDFFETLSSVMNQQLH